MQVVVVPSCAMRSQAPWRLLASRRSRRGHSLPFEVTSAGTVRYPLPTADSVSIDSDNEVILCRSKGMVFAFAPVVSASKHRVARAAREQGLSMFASQVEVPPRRHVREWQGHAQYGPAAHHTRRRRGGRRYPRWAYESDTQPDKWGAAFVRVS